MKGIKQQTMKTYCPYCMSERELVYNSHTYNNKTKEKKIEGVCLFCGSRCTHIVVTKEV